MTPIKIDFVSDIACPWCAVGLASLEQAIERLGDEVSISLHFQPFELNPDMPPEGEDILAHLMRKYQITAEQVAQNHEHIRERGAAVGFSFNLEGRKRTYNTFNAHRLLHWAAEIGGADAQRRLKWRLLSAYFSEGADPSSHEALLAAVDQTGLDVTQAAEILNGDSWRDEVRQQQQFYLSQGIHSVPAVIINDRYLVQGGQPPEAFEQALRQIVAES
ncbi:MAG: DsbA family oxidoreductase [Oxalobacteraceae bacterium]|jgi:predicted DsbA family dithiol-disulfide isomerase|nr:DsbA family oxidoreductase [Oxalobacteraceae bacterium]